MSDEQAELGQRLRLIREARGISPEELGAPLSLTGSTIRRYESGTRDPGSATLRRLAILLDVSLDYLFGLTDRPGFTGRKLRLQDYLAHLPGDVRQWVAGPGSTAYVVLAKGASDSGLDPATLTMLVNAVRHEILKEGTKNPKL